MPISPQFSGSNSFSVPVDTTSGAPGDIYPNGYSADPTPPASNSGWSQLVTSFTQGALAIYAARNAPKPTAPAQSKPQPIQISQSSQGSTPAIVGASQGLSNLFGSIDPTMLILALGIGIIAFIVIKRMT